MRFAVLRSLFAVLALSCAPIATAPAQLRVHSGTCDWRLARPAFDNYIGDGHAGGFTAPRYVHHAATASLSALAAIGLHKVTRLPTWAAATVAVVGVGLVPHVRGYMRGTYDINVQDWIADAVIRSGPAWYAIAHGSDTRLKHDTRSHVLAGTTYLASYLAVACWASP